MFAKALSLVIDYAPFIGTFVAGYFGISWSKSGLGLAWTKVATYLTSKKDTAAALDDRVKAIEDALVKLANK